MWARRHGRAPPSPTRRPPMRPPRRKLDEGAPREQAPRGICHASPASSRSFLLVGDPTSDPHYRTWTLPLQHASLRRYPAHALEHPALPPSRESQASPSAPQRDEKPAQRPGESSARTSEDVGVWGGSSGATLVSRHRGLWATIQGWQDRWQTGEEHPWIQMHLRTHQANRGAVETSEGNVAGLCAENTQEVGFDNG
ncbi:hypothetical protein B0H15DRAFT_1020880 [Mycena belliarum]|uniref:Uncharacterized protein n=1 Tax=Mycena belliarum TaxID=1033014 RepID=A0AAD6U6G7_9AGAR|nr:hypothetical protein B0H15DRAFT_1020880 [Mycena belliae]